MVTCFAGHSRRAAAGNCALYARAVTGVDLYGAAGGWWYEAAGRYQRGQSPAVGSILVFRPTGSIPSGHVAVVAKVVGPSMVLVDQSNWYHGQVTLRTPVVDTSPNHDWTTVAVMDLGSGQLGRDNPTFGFVYPQNGSSQFVASAETGGFEPYVATGRAAYDPGQQAALFHFAVVDGYRHPSWGAAHGRAARHSIRLRSAHGHNGAARTPHHSSDGSAHSASSRPRPRYRTASAG
jgi:hypothetical protein